MRTILIDADIVAYQASAGSESKYDWGDTGGEVKATDFKGACRSAEEQIKYLKDKLDAAEVVICLSDDFQNFREGVYPQYKQNRGSTERPEHLYDLKDWLREEYEVAERQTLEADDVMGIMSTEPHEGERVIVSEDKDMQTIPGLLFNPNKDKKVRKITPHFAERYMLHQALTGDVTDGYPGCPGIGPTNADRALDKNEARVPYEHELKSGPRKGETETRYRYETFGSPWETIVACYEAAGLTENDAIVQVNLARILKHSDVDGSTVIPWKPSDLREMVN